MDGGALAQARAGLWVLLNSCTAQLHLGLGELCLSLPLPTFPGSVPSTISGLEFPRQSQPRSMGWGPSLLKKRKMLLWKLQQH